MIKEMNVNIPQWFELDELVALHTIESPSKEKTGILIASENFDNGKMCNPTVRLYLIEEMEGVFEVTKELDAYPFKTLRDAQQFAQQLPTMNTFDLLYYLNQKQQVFLK